MTHAQGVNLPRAYSHIQLNFTRIRSREYRAVSSMYVFLFLLVYYMFLFVLFVNVVRYKRYFSPSLKSGHSVDVVGQQDELIASVDEVGEHGAEELRCGA